MMNPRTCVHPRGKFIVGVHRPRFDVKNLRENETLEILGQSEDGSPVDNRVNFPKTDIHEPKADLIYEIANPFPFRGATFINSAWADPKVGRTEIIGIQPPPPCSLVQAMDRFIKDRGEDEPLSEPEKIRFLEALPRPVRLGLAQSSTDPGELAALARTCCKILFKPESKIPWGLGYKKKKDGTTIPDIKDHEVFEVLVNNRFLPDEYKEVLVLRPGVQGKSEIIGEVVSENGQTHVFEYLRRNSYIPWGHFASNMANDAVRYRAKDLSSEDMEGIRHLYYQRIFVRTAEQLNLRPESFRKNLTPEELEELRKSILDALESAPDTPLDFNAALWGWNFGFGSAQSGHRLHASHQMIHQQNAMIPGQVEDRSGRPYDCFSFGDLVTDFIHTFKKTHGISFFNAFLEAIRTNERTDGRFGESSLIVFEDENIILFVPKAQVSEWELQIITQKECDSILQADTGTRRSLDLGILTAVQVLEALGAQMVTSIELSGRLDRMGSGQHLMYSFIPRLPYAPGTFSEAQLRWISGCYPEDFAHACRRTLDTQKENP
nr:hypothetical protein [Desulfospira joergensenii]